MIKKIQQKLEKFPGWGYENNKISKVFEFKSCTDAVRFLEGLVDFCNNLDHHPDITINYKKIRFELTRYSIGGKMTEKDFIVARRIEDDYNTYRSKTETGH